MVHWQALASQLARGHVPAAATVPYAAPTRHYFKNLACGHAEMRGELLLLGPLGSAHTLPCPAARTLLPAEWRCITPRGCLCTERWQQYTDTALSDSASHSGRPPRARTVLQQVAGVVSLACVASVPQSLLVAVVYEGVACWHTPPAHVQERLGGGCWFASRDPPVNVAVQPSWTNTRLDGLSARLAAKPAPKANARAPQLDAAGRLRAQAAHAHRPWATGLPLSAHDRPKRTSAR
jgi:hypothetical protein